MPRRHGVELHTDKHHGQGLRLDWSDKPVRQVGHADDKHITKCNIPDMNDALERDPRKVSLSRLEDRRFRLVHLFACEQPEVRKGLFSCG